MALPVTHLFLLSAHPLLLKLSQSATWKNQLTRTFQIQSHAFSVRNSVMARGAAVVVLSVRDVVRLNTLLRDVRNSWSAQVVGASYGQLERVHQMAVGEAGAGTEGQRRGLGCWGKKARSSWMQLSTNTCFRRQKQTQNFTVSRGSNRPLRRILTNWITS